MYDSRPPDWEGFKAGVIAAGTAFVGALVGAFLIYLLFFYGR